MSSLVLCPESIVSLEKASKVLCFVEVDKGLVNLLEYFTGFEVFLPRSSLRYIFVIDVITLLSSIVFLYSYKISEIQEKYETIAVNIRNFSLQSYVKIFLKTLKLLPDETQMKLRHKNSGTKNYGTMTTIDQYLRN